MPRMPAAPAEAPSSDDELRSACLAGDARGVVAVLRRLGPTDAASAAAGCHAVARLASAGHGRCTAVLEAGGMAAVAAALDVHVASAAVAKRACTAVEALVSMAPPADPLCHDALATGVHVAVGMAVEAHACSNAAAALHAMRALSLLCFSRACSPGAGAPVDRGVHAALARAAAATGATVFPPVAEAGLHQALGVVTRHPHLMVEPFDVSCFVRAAVAAMNRHGRTHADVTTLGGTLLAELVARGHVGPNQLAGGAPMMVKMLRACCLPSASVSARTGLAGATVAALGAMLDRDAVAPVVHAGGPDALLDAPSRRATPRWPWQ